MDSKVSRFLFLFLFLFILFPMQSFANDPLSLTHRGGSHHFGFPLLFDGCFFLIGLIAYTLHFCRSASMTSPLSSNFKNKTQFKAPSGPGVRPCPTPAPLPPHHYGNAIYQLATVSLSFSFLRSLSPLSPALLSTRTSASHVMKCKFVSPSSVTWEEGGKTVPGLLRYCALRNDNGVLSFFLYAYFLD
jgi:hypothetical protein